MTTSVEKTIEVEAPVRTVYDQWTQFEEFPQFMGGVSSVTQTSDRTLHWVAEIGGVRREWDAQILEQVPDEKVAWAATSGATNAGAVYFAPSGAGRTLVRLHLEFQPEGLVEKAGDALGLVERRAEADLERFKAFIEARGKETGGWRGEVPGEFVGTPGVDDAAASRGDSGKAGVSTTAKVAGVAAAAAAGVAAAATLKGGSQGSGTTDTSTTGSGTSSAAASSATTGATTAPAAAGSPAETEDGVVVAPASGQTYPASGDEPNPLPRDTQSRPL